MSDPGAASNVEPEVASPSSEAESEPQNAPSVLDDLLENMGHTEKPAPTAPAPAPAPGLRSARLVTLDKRRATIAWRGQSTPIAADIAPEVEDALLALALRQGDGVLVEVAPEDKPVIVGVLQTKLPREVHIKADEIHFEAARELVLRAGRAALRLREDGDVELVGTRISASSRGLFRLVGRILRLN
jgi:hypothetical protein